MKPYLFQVGHTKYAVIARTKRHAYHWIKEVQRIKDYTYLGIDTRSSDQQWNDRSTVGVKLE